MSVNVGERPGTKQVNLNDFPWGKLAIRFGKETILFSGEFGFLTDLTRVDISSDLRFHVLSIEYSGDSFVRAVLTWVV